MADSQQSPRDREAREIAREAAAVIRSFKHGYGVSAKPDLPKETR